MEFAHNIRNWYQKHRRELPWRDTSDPYLIWLSEVILQQTRVDQGLAYYHKFAKHYPTVNHLANASEDEVLKDWQGLGYYSRARNLHAAAKNIAFERKGVFPSNAKEWQTIKGVGPYTAAAISSFAYNEAVPVVDGNVYRVLARIFGIATPIDSGAGQKEFYALALSLIDKKEPAEFNQAIMEFGSLQCSPKNPKCGSCVFSDTCVAFSEDAIAAYPFKAKKLKQRERYFHYIVLRSADQFAVDQRTEKGIWQQLYQFPLIETEKALDTEALLQNETFAAWTGGKAAILRTSNTYKHLLSHQKIHARFWEVEISTDNFNQLAFTRIKEEEFAHLAVPRLIDRYWKDRSTAAPTLF